MIAIIDYGAGNLFSVQNALNFLNIEGVVTSDKKVIEESSHLILPGVGAFPDAMKMLNSSGLIDLIKTEAQKKPLLGICLGMQLLFDKSYEFAQTDGLGLINGYVDLMKPDNLVIPQMGWNVLEKNKDSKITENVGENEYVYFVHSYAAFCKSEYVAAYTDYGANVPAIVFKDNIFGCQFHPEKSGGVGLKILKSFSEI